MNFTKMQGCGNDYIFLSPYDNEHWPLDLPQFAREVSDRRFGVGADGLIVIEPSHRADARMRIWNADGSEAEMCGNGIRCAARLIHERGWSRRGVRSGDTSENLLRIETKGGVRDVELTLERGAFVSARVNMGPPIFAADAIPVLSDVTPPSPTTLIAGEQSFRVGVVSMGNPHCVLILDDQQKSPARTAGEDALRDFPVATVGPLLERHAIFPRGANVEFVRLIDRLRLETRVWERGAGETLACGTGACAAVVVASLLGHCDRSVRVAMPGGELRVEWAETGDVFLSGPAMEVCTGTWTRGEPSSFLPLGAPDARGDWKLPRSA